MKSVVNHGVHARLVIEGAPVRVAFLDQGNNSTSLLRDRNRGL
jgi:hypothetical protein